MKAQIQQLTNSLNTEMNPEFFKGISKLIHELRICLPDFHEVMDEEFLEYIYENVSTKRCDLLMHSNLGKYKVDIFRKNKKAGKTTKLPKQKSNVGALFHMFLDKLGNICEKQPDNTIYFSGDKYFVTFKSIFEECGLGNAGYAPRAARESLIQSGCIKMVMPNMIKFISKIPNSLNSDNDTVRQISNTIHRYISTQFKNRAAHQNNTYKIMEKSMMSDCIPDNNIEVCFDTLKQNFVPPFLQGKQILEDHESNTSTANYAVGYQLFFFKTEL